MIKAPNESKTGTAGAAASEIAMDMSPQRQYRLTAIAAIWFRIVKAGGSGAAVNGDGSHYLAAGFTFDVAPIGDRNRVSIIRVGGADTQAILSEIVTVVA